MSREQTAGLVGQRGQSVIPERLYTPYQTPLDAAGVQTDAEARYETPGTERFSKTPLSPRL